MRQLHLEGSCHTYTHSIFHPVPFHILFCSTFHSLHIVPSLRCLVTANDEKNYSYRKGCDQPWVQEAMGGGGGGGGKGEHRPLPSFLDWGGTGGTKKWYSTCRSLININHINHADYL